MSNHTNHPGGHPGRPPARRATSIGAVLSQVTLLAFVVAAAMTAAASDRRRREPADRGQAMTEYVLLLLGVAAIALLVTGWAARTGKVGELLDRVFDTITGRVA